MLPGLGDSKVDKILSNFSQAYRNENYISEFILPVLKVVEKTGKYAKYGKDNLRDYGNNIYRAPGTRAMSINYTVSQGDYVLFPGNIYHSPEPSYGFGCRDSIVVFIRRK